MSRQINLFFRWQLETIPDNDDPKTFKLDYRYNLISGVTSLRRYGVYMLRDIWPAALLQYVDEVLIKLSYKTKVNDNIPHLFLKCFVLSSAVISNITQVKTESN